MDRLQQIREFKISLEYREATNEEVYSHQCCQDCKHAKQGWRNVRCDVIKHIVKRYGLCKKFESGRCEK